jgi:CHAT domain-containing protein/tetratricopeptide (TPR) repeat protein
VSNWTQHSRAVVLVLVAGCGPVDAPRVPAAPPVARQPLVQGFALERSNATAGSWEHFEVALRPGDLLEIVASQRGADVVLHLLDPTGKPLVAFDRPIGRHKPERLVFHAERGGVYGVDLEIDKVDEGGGYALAVPALRSARPEERLAAEVAFTYARASQHRRDRHWADAATHYREAVRGFARLGAEDDRADALLWLGRVSVEAGDWLGAVRAFEELRPNLKPTDWLGLARAEAQLGQAEAAFTANHRGRELARETGDRVSEALALHQIAALLRDVGQLPAAEWAYERAAALYRQGGSPDREATVLLALTSLYIEVEAPELARRTLDLASTARAAANVGDPFLSLQAAQVARLEGRPDEARRMAEALLAEGTAKVGLREGARALLLRLARDRRDWPVAERLARERLAALNPGSADATLALQDLGQILIYRGQIAAARDALERALAASREAAPRERAAILFGLARAARAEGRTLAAWNFATEALDLVEGFREGAERPELRLAWTADTQDYFDLAVGLAVDLERSEPGAGHLQRALETSERGRARGLLDDLAPARGGLGRRAQLEDRRRKIERIREALITSGAGPEELGATEAELRTVVLEIEALPVPRLDRLTLPRTRGTSTELRGGAVLAAARETLATGVQILEFDLGEERSHLFLLDRAGAAVFDLPSRSELEALAREAHEVLAGSFSLTAGTRPERVLEVLGAVLLGPVAARLDDGPVVVIPDGALWLVPFGALEVPHGGRMLVEGHEVLAAPSLGVLAAIRARGRGAFPANPRVAVFADPVFLSTDRRAAPPVTEPQWPEGDEVHWRSEGGRLERLVHSAEEAQVLRELVGADRLEVAEGFEATKARLVRLPPRSLDLLHLATHGFYHPREPSLSGLVLSLLDERGRPQDGVLRAHEIAELGLAPRLVVASACATAQGREIRGEGVVSLAHAFFRAGSSRVLVTLWPVDDEASALLMRHFYRALLLEGATPAAALRQAQLALRADPRFRAPFYWAGFVLQGEP